MTRTAVYLLTAGVALFVGVLLSQGLPAIFATLSLAGWGLLLVALFHLAPLVLDAIAIRVLFDRTMARGSIRDSLLTRWAGESANSFLPAGQIAGPMLMVRQLSLRGMPVPEAAAAITVSTTLQSVAQVLFALLGMALLGARASQISQHDVRIPILVASGLLTACLAGFYLMQRRGLFGKLMRAAARFSGKRDWSQLLNHAAAIDVAVEAAYGRKGPVAASFLLSLVGWLIGTGEVYLILQLLQHPVGWGDALLLESLGQAIRGAAFAVPGSLGVQEGGYLLLAPLVGLPPDAALALSLAKRAREILLGLPGLLYLHVAERGWRRRRVACAGAGE